jgi:hypothetical protein
VENEVNSLDVGSWTPLLGLRLSLKVPKIFIGKTLIKGAKPEDSNGNFFGECFKSPCQHTVRTFAISGTQYGNFLHVSIKIFVHVGTSKNIESTRRKREQDHTF